MSSRNNRHHAKLCRNFALGHCPQGDRCKYLHPIVAPPPPNLSVTRPPLTLDVHRPSYSPYVDNLSPLWSAHPADMIPRSVMIYPANSYNAPASQPTIPAPQYKPLSWRTALCRHYTKNRGWCPLGDDCNFIHDLELADMAHEDIRFLSRGKAAEGSGDEPRGRAGSKHSHCWAYVQGLCHVQNCPYLHPAAVHMFICHTPCLAWPNCHKGALCPYKHPEPIIPKVQTLPPSLDSTPNLQPPSPVDSTLSGAVQYHGTTYFPLASHPSLSPSTTTLLQTPAQDMRRYEVVPMVYGQHFSAPQHPTFHSPPWHMPISPPQVQTTPNYQYGAPVPYDASSCCPPAAAAATARSPVWDDRLIYAAEPPSHTMAYRPMPPPNVQSDPSVPRSSGAYQSIMERFSKMAASASASAPAEEEFPYVAPKVQRVGHARRISVALKSKEDTDALGLFRHTQTPAGEGAAAAAASISARQGWQTHGSRQTHKSWAPSSTSMTFL